MYRKCLIVFILLSLIFNCGCLGDNDNTENKESKFNNTDYNLSENSENNSNKNNYTDSDKNINSKDDKFQFKMQSGTYNSS